MRTNRPCSPLEIMEVIVGAGFEAPDRQKLVQAIEVELMTATSSQGRAAFQRQEGSGDRWSLSPAFTAWLMNRGLPSLQGLMPRFPIETANDG
jgi:hypothetical protein